MVTKAKCRHLKKSTQRQVLFMCSRRSPPFLGFCFGWSSSFVGSESGQTQSVKLLQNMVSNRTQHPQQPHPVTATQSINSNKHLPQSPLTGQLFQMTNFFYFAFYESYLSTGQPLGEAQFIFQCHTCKGQYYEYVFQLLQRIIKLSLQFLSLCYFVECHVNSSTHFMRNVEKLIFYFLELKRENLFDYQFTQTWRMCLHKICQYKKVSYFQTIYMKQNTYNINHRKFTKNIASSIVLSENAKNDVIFSTLEPISSTKGIVS